jgi:hypothetical protein
MCRLDCGHPVINLRQFHPETRFTSLPWQPSSPDLVGSSSGWSKWWSYREEPRSPRHFLIAKPHSIQTTPWNVSVDGLFMAQVEPVSLHLIAGLCCPIQRCNGPAVALARLTQADKEFYIFVLKLLAHDMLSWLGKALHASISREYRSESERNGYLDINIVERDAMPGVRDIQIPAAQAALL